MFTRLSLFILFFYSPAIAKSRLDSLLDLGMEKFSSGDYVESNKTYKLLLTLPEVATDKSKQANLYNRIALNYGQMGLLEPAINTYMIALGLEKKLGPEGGRWMFNNIGLIYWKLKNYKLAEESYHQVLSFAQEKKDDVMKGLAYNNLGLIYMETKNYQTSFKNFKYSISIFEHKDRPSDLANAYNNLGLLYYKMNFLDSADYFLNKALDIRIPILDMDGLSASYFNLANLSSAKNRDRDAIRYAKLSLQAAESRCNPTRTKDAVLLLSELYDKLSKQDSSLFFLKKFTALSDSLYDSENINRLAYFQSFMDNELKTFQIRSLQVERKIGNLRLKYGIALISIGLLIIAFFIHRRFSLVIRQKQMNLINLNNAQSILLIKEEELKEYLLTLSRKNTVIDNLQEELAKLRHESESIPEQKHLTSDELINYRILTDEDWINFRDKFSVVYPGFLSVLKLSVFDFTEGEIRLLAMQKLNLSNKEIANCLGISNQSVRVARVRLKKKLNEHNVDSIEDYMITIRSQEI